MLSIIPCHHTVRNTTKKMAYSHSVASNQMGRRRVGHRYLAGAFEMGGVGLDKLVGVHILHRPRSRSRHPAAAARDERKAGKFDAAALG